MKKYLLFTLIFIIIFAGCQSKESVQPTASPTQYITVTNAPTAEVKPTATEVPTPEPTNLPPLQEDQLGVPQDDAEVVYYDNFEDGYISPEALFRYNNGHQVVENQLYLSYYRDANVELADSYAADIYCEVKDDINQYQFHLKFKTSHEKAEKSPWMSALIGVRVYEPQGGGFLPKDENSGLYIAVTQFGKILLFHGIPSHWPTGACSIDIPQGFGEMGELTIVDTGNKIYFYQSVSETERKLFLSIDVGGDTLKVYNSNNEEVYSAENNLKQDKGGYFKIFNHFGRTVIDEFSIKKR